MRARRREGRRTLTTRVDDPASSPVNSIKTYRYLRLAMPALVLLLFAALTIEWFAGGRRCVQESISSYYYTPAQGVFVGALVAIGACLVVIKGNTQAEDVLLNVAGMLAPVVAFVPTVHVGACRSVTVPVYDTSASIVNNIGALLVVGVAGMVVTGFVARGERVAGRPAGRSRMGLPAAVLTVLLVAAGYFGARPTFLVKGHYVAALVMFACIVTVVLMNARGLGDSREEAGATRVKAYLNRYALIAVLMVGSLLVMIGWRWATGWQHALLWVEGVLIVLFALFWCVQTHELWNTIRRSRALAYAPSPSRRTPVSARTGRYSVRSAGRGQRAGSAGRVDSVRRSARR